MISLSLQILFTESLLLSPIQLDDAHNVATESGILLVEPHSNGRFVIALTNHILTHPGPQHLRNHNSPIGLLIIFQHSDDGSST